MRHLNALDESNYERYIVPVCVRPRSVSLNLKLDSQIESSPLCCPARMGVMSSLADIRQRGRFSESAPEPRQSEIQVIETVPLAMHGRSIMKTGDKRKKKVASASSISASPLQVGEPVFDG